MADIGTTAGLAGGIQGASKSIADLITGLRATRKRGVAREQLQDPAFLSNLASLSATEFTPALSRRATLGGQAGEDPTVTAGVLRQLGAGFAAQTKPPKQPTPRRPDTSRELADQSVAEVAKLISERDTLLGKLSTESPERARVLQEKKDLRKGGATVVFIRKYFGDRNELPSLDEAKRFLGVGTFDETAFKKAIAFLESLPPEEAEIPSVETIQSAAPAAAPEGPGAPPTIVPKPARRPAPALAPIPKGREELGPGFSFTQ